MIFNMKFKGVSFEKKLLYMFFELILITYSIMIILPLINMFISSLKSTREIFMFPYSLPQSISFKNYVQVWIKGNFGIYFLNSVIVTGSSLFLTLFLGSLAAYAIARYSYKLNTLIYLIFLSGIMLPLKSAIISLFLMMKTLRLLNTYWALIFVYTAMSLPSTVFILTGFMRSLPRDLENAARIDGCSEFGIYRRIILPLSKQGLAIVAIYNGVPIWNDFFFPLVFIQNDKLKTLPLGMTVFFGQYQTNWGLLFAALSIAIIPIITVYILLSNQFIRGITAGAIK
ncbi:MAG: carbohydrate ABC transporter permease [Thermotogae bacterium]|nr:carbohydrate ABC transporter permease [Thermotogota bacterium]